MKTQRLKIFIAATALLSTTSLSSAWTGDGVNGAVPHGNPAGERGVNDHASETMHFSPLLRTAMDQVNFAQVNLGHARETGNRRQIENAGGMLINAENMLTGILSETTDVPSAEIIDLHRSGLSWSEINIRLGVALSDTPSSAGDYMHETAGMDMNSYGTYADDGSHYYHGTGTPDGGSIRVRQYRNDDRSFDEHHRLMMGMH